MTLKLRFLEAVSKGELGEVDDFGVVVSLREFKTYFSDVTSDYINSFLPAAVIETGQYTATHTKYLFRIRKGQYRVHPDALKQYQAAYMNSDDDSRAVDQLYDPKVEEQRFYYKTACVN